MLKTKLLSSPSEPTEAHITAKEFVDIFTIHRSLAGRNARILIIFVRDDKITLNC